MSAGIATNAKASGTKNSVFFVIDALRYDTLSNREARNALFPHLAAIIDGGYVKRIVANAQATQFVMPALFTQTYPLDYGGYNNGIKERPKSYIETLNSAGYSTYLYSACNQLGTGFGYERGFINLHTNLDYRLIIEHRISRFLSYHIVALRSQEQDRHKVIETIGSDLKTLMMNIVQHFESEEKSAWPKPLYEHNARIYANAQAEINLIDREPEVLLKKLETISAGIYWRYLGRRAINRYDLLLQRLIESFRWRTRRWLNRRRFPPFILLSHFEATADEIVSPVEHAFRTGAIKTPFHMHIHVMDVHDARSLSRLTKFLGRLRYFPRWLRGRLRGHTRRHWIYDTALMAVDAELGRLRAALRAAGNDEDSCFVILGDHGNNFALSPRTKPAISTRTYREDIEVPLVVRAPWIDASVGSGMHDSMSASATTLHCLDVDPHPSFRGRHLFEDGRIAVVSESAGSGAADMVAKDLFFTVTGETHKLLATLSGDRLTIDQVYDLTTDPLELNNIVGDAACADEVARLSAFLFEERAEVMAMRGVDQNAA